MYEIVATKRFTKQLKKIVKQNAKVKQEVMTVIDMLVQKKALPAKYHDHPLKGSRRGERDCHIFSDIVLIYQYHDEFLILKLLEIGSHAQLFG